MNKKIKVAFVITRLIQGGAQRVCLDLVERLDRTRYDITLIAGLETGSEGSLFEEAEKWQLRMIRLPLLVRSISPVKDILAFAQLFFIFLREKMTIVHAHTSKAGVLGVLAARLAGVPVVIYSSHGHIFDSRAQLRDVNPKSLGHLFRLRQWICRLSDKVIALTPQDEKEQVEMGMAPYGKFKVIFNGIDLKHFNRSQTGDKEPILRELKLEPSDFPRICCVSRLSPEKGVGQLLAAMAPILRELPKARLLLIGDGPERSRLLQQAKDLNLEARVNFLRRRTDVPRVLSVSDIFVLPSLYEAMGIVIAKAMAMELPVIATRVGGVPGVIENGVTGLLVEPGQPAAIADAVKLLARDEMLRKKIAANGYQKAHEYFSVERMVEETDRLYQEMLKRNNLSVVGSPS